MILINIFIIIKIVLMSNKDRNIKRNIRILKKCLHQ